MWCFIHFSFYMNTQLLWRCIIQTHQREKYSQRIKCTATAFLTIWGGCSYFLSKNNIQKWKSAAINQIQIVTFPIYADAALGIYVMKGKEFEALYGINVLLLSVVVIFQTQQRQLKHIYERHKEMVQSEGRNFTGKWICIPPSVALNGSAENNWSHCLYAHIFTLLMGDIWPSNTPPLEQLLQQ